MKLTERIGRWFEKIKYFFTIDIKKFVWYCTTEPLRQLVKGFDVAKRNIDVVQRIQVWMFIFAALSILMVMVKRYVAAEAFAVCFIMVVIHYEWKKGSFRQRWKEKEFKRIQSEMEKKRTEDEKNEHIATMAIRDSGTTLDNSRDSNSNPGNIHTSEQDDKKQEGKENERTSS